MPLIMYSTGKKFAKLIAEALKGENPEAESDVLKLMDFVRDETGFKITNATLKQKNEVLMTLRVK